MNTFKRFLVLLVAGFCMLGFNADPARAATVDVTVNDYGFQLPSTIIKIHKGDTVRWTNTGTVVHNVTSGFTDGPHSKVPDGFIDSGPIAPGAAFEQIFTFHGIFDIYDKYTDTGGGAIDVDYDVFISPESSVFSSFQGFDLAFHFNNSSPITQCSIFLDGVDMGDCNDVFADPNFQHPWGPRGGIQMISIPPHSLQEGLYSVSIKVVTADGQAYSDTAWYRIHDGGLCGARGC